MKKTTKLCFDQCKKYFTGYKARKSPSMFILHFELLGKNLPSVLLLTSGALGTHPFAVLRACEHQTLTF